MKLFEVYLALISQLSMVMSDCGAQLNAFYKCDKSVFDKHHPNIHKKQMAAYSEVTACFENSGCLSPAEAVKKQLEEAMEEKSGLEDLQNEIRQKSSIKQCVREMLLDDLIGTQMEQCIQERYAMPDYNLPVMAQNFRAHGNRSDNSSDGDEPMIMTMQQYKSGKLDIFNPLIVSNLIFLMDNGACPNVPAKTAVKSCLQQVAINHFKDSKMDECSTPVEMAFQKRDKMRSFCLDKQNCYNKFEDPICKEAYKSETQMLCACAGTTMERRSLQAAMMKGVAQCTGVSKETIAQDPGMYKNVMRIVLSHVKQITDEFCGIERQNACEEKFGDMGMDAWDAATSFCHIYPDGWNYDESSICGPSNWVSRYPECGGKEQSPMNIVPSLSASNLAIPDLVFENFDRFLDGLVLENNGHSMELNIHESVAHGTLSIDDLPRVSGAGLPGTYEIVNIHWHWGPDDCVGSEHTFNGENYPLEQHVVFKLEGMENMDLKPRHSYVVLATLYSIRCNSVPLESVVKSLRAVELPETTTKLATKIKLRDLLPECTDKYFTYSGSFTTPPCSELVKWFVFKETKSVTKEQMADFRTIQNEEGRTEIPNNRPEQPMNGRSLTLRKPVLDTCL